MIEWIRCTKSTLDSIKKLAQLSEDRFNNKEFGKFLPRMITEDIHKTDLLLNGLLNYIQVTTPIKKKNTVNILIEEVLKKNKIQLEEKGVKLFKKLEKDLPEIIVPDEQLKYILNNVLQYVTISTPPNGSIEFLTKSFIFQKDVGGAQAFFEKHGGYIEILVVLIGDREPAGHPGAALGRVPSLQEDEALELILRRVKGMVLKNQGLMKFETDEKRSKTIISLRFPLERRKVVFYEPIRINPPVNHLRILNI